MTTRKPDAPAAVASPLAPSGTTYLFTQRERKRAPAMTSERIADDMEVFRNNGGKIEVLGTTRSLKRIGVDQTPVAAAARTRPT